MTVYEVERKQAIRHLQRRLVYVLCNYAIGDPEGRRQMRLVCSKIQRLRNEL